VYNLKQFQAGECTADVYWAQFISPAVVIYIDKLFPKKRMAASSDGSFPDMSARHWEFLAVHMFCDKSAFAATGQNNHTDASEPVARLVAKRLWSWWQSHANEKSINTKDICNG
jgi:hypothetical protein